MHAFTTRDTGGGAHWVIEIEGDFRGSTTAGHADDIVDLHFAAGTDAEVAMDAGVEVNAHGDVAGVKQRDIDFRFRETTGCDVLGFGHVR